MDVKRTIDINCDLGEGMKNDAELMLFISSCSVACGGHFGTKETIRKTILLAREHGVKVGAHPSYPDKANFGRKQLNLDPSELRESISTQLTDFLIVCNEEGINPNHIKLHGALYNVAAKDESTARLVAKVFQDLQLKIPVFAPKRSILASVLEGILPVISEGFIDRKYQENGNLLSRNEANALIESPEIAWKQLKQMYFNHEVQTSNGKIIPLVAETFCLHGDALNAVSIAKHLNIKLKEYAISIKRS